MSRLRARTWTPVERECMEWYRHWSTQPNGIEETRNAVGDWPMGGTARTMGVYAMAVFQVIATAERIMRTKGVDLDLARLRAGRDVEKQIDPVTGMGYNELVEIANDVNGRRWREGRIRWGARMARKRYSPHANRKYPLRGLYRSLPSHPSRPVGPTNDVWFDYGPWVPSDFNPNIYVRAL